MNIQIKNIKIYEALSEETTCFTADVFVNGKKIAYAKNNGHGDSTYYNTYNPKHRPILEAAEEFAKTLPSTFYRNLEIKSTLENLIDDAISNKEQLKEMEYGILVGKPDSPVWEVFAFTGNPKLKKLSPEMLQKLVDSAKSHIKDGEVILNTNLTDLQVTL
jgi:hypothetical protein